MLLERINGPECPTCGCRDGETLRAHGALWGEQRPRRRCNHCGRTFTAGLAYRPAKQPHCPECGSPNTKITSSPLPIRWHKCQDCDAAFKTVE